MLNGVLLLAAYTARSQTYAQALRQRNLNPQWVLMYGEEPAPAAVGTTPTAATPTAATPTAAAALFIPDLGIALKTSCAEAGWSIEELAERDVNAARLRGRIAALAPRLIVFSGYGGQIVGADLRDLGIPLLHAHSGWLPDYRGSTTIYYSMLRERRCAVSVLQLAARIDAGDVIARRHYPLPAAGTDVDLIYDNAIRADLLMDVLARYRVNGSLGECLVQQEAAGTTYYVIHPVLKHLALLMTEDETPAS